MFTCVVVVVVVWWWAWVSCIYIAMEHGYMNKL